MTSLHGMGISLDSFISQLNDPVHVMDTRGNIQQANARWCQRLQYEPEAVPALNFYEDVLDTASRRSIRADLQSRAQSAVHHPLQAVLLSREGDEVLVEMQFITYADHDRIICIAHELDPRSQTHLDLERMFGMSVDMLGIADYEGRFTYLNPAWETILGYPQDELLGEHFIDFVHPDDRERTMIAAQEAIQENSVHKLVNRYLCKDGSTRWLSWHYVSYPDMQQTYFVARDVTHERENQELLQEARDQLQAILDNSGTVIGLKDLDGAYILVNQEFADVFGQGDKNKILGRDDDEIFSTSIAAVLAEHDRAVLTSHRSLQFEESITTSEGTRTFLTTRFLLDDQDGMPYAICMIAKDITYRKLTELQLLMRNQAIEHSPTGISIADARLPDLPLIYVNPAFEKATGYSALDVIGRNCRFLQGEDRDQEGVRQLREAIHNEEAVTVVLRNYRKDGTMFYNELGIAPIHNNAGELTHYVGISTDVTQRIEAQEKIQQQNQELVETNAELARARKQAEDATRLKSQFLATMSHELRTPLNAIIGYTEIQLAGMTGDITDEQRDYQERVLTNADHLLNLINDVLDISKIEAGRLDLVHKPFNLRDWVQSVDDQMRVLADEKQLKFMVEVDSRMPERIVGDPARIKQVVINLLSNAIKFTEQGTVRLVVRKYGRDAWRVVIEDTGIGIPPHMQETIFEEFRQVDSSSRRRSGGTGLGLAIVRKLLLMMGGNVRLSSHLGEGSTFVITLPLVEAASAVSSPVLGETTHD